MASIEVIQYSISDLWKGFFNGEPLHIEAGWVMYAILGSGTLAKLVLFFYCKQFTESDSVSALAEDHLNDVLSNVAAIVTASIAAHIQKLWWIDPIGEHLSATVLQCSFHPCNGVLRPAGLEGMYAERHIRWGNLLQVRL